MVTITQEAPEVPHIPRDWKSMIDLLKGFFPIPVMGSRQVQYHFLFIQHVYFFYMDI
jgi:hypothetical protein